MNIVDALRRGKQRLSNSESANLDTEVLLCYCLKCERSKLYSHPEQTLSDNEIKSFDSLITLRTEGYPVAHLTHEKEFWSLILHISKETLIPRPETELLVETALTLIPRNVKKNILDLGTGSGAIAVAIASERPDIKLTATDISHEALKIAKRNAESNNIENIEFKKANWLNI
ncbi:MAG: HemK/PrmC family methyltransferase, partial [Pseudomonadota bacterium]